MRLSTNGNFGSVLDAGRQVITIEELRVVFKIGLDRLRLRKDVSEDLAVDPVCLNKDMGHVGDWYRTGDQYFSLIVGGATRQMCQSSIPVMPRRGMSLEHRFEAIRSALHMGTVVLGSVDR